MRPPEPTPWEREQACRVMAGISTDRQATEEMFRRSMGAARACLEDERSTDYVPKLEVLCRKGPGAEDELHLYALAINFNGHDEKVAILRQIAAGIHEGKLFPACVALTAEAWESTYAAGNRLPKPQPRNDPQRKEVILASALSLDGKHCMFNSMPVTRTKDNRIVPGQWGEPKYTEVQSPLLQHFFKGFWAAAARKAGWTIPELGGDE